jgi:hypothetical protein
MVAIVIEQLQLAGEQRKLCSLFCEFGPEKV